MATGVYDRTGRHCQATNPTGNLDVAKHAGQRLRHETGAPLKRRGTSAGTGA